MEKESLEFLTAEVTEIEEEEENLAQRHEGTKFG